MPDNDAFLDKEAAMRVEETLLGRIGEATPEKRLDATRRVLELLGDPQQMYGVIHIAGTNGKTSTARIIESLLRAHGLRTGLMTSPHLHRMTERISIDGEPIGDRQFADNWSDIEPFIHMVDAELVANGRAPLTYFETLTVLGFAAFADAPVDVAVIETGMGGEWDATNAANGDVCVITPIGLDHMEQLGPTISAIAKTKAGIIKPASRVVSSEQTPEAWLEIVAACEQNEAPLAALGRDFSLTSIEPAVGGQLISIDGVAGEYSGLFLPLLGDHQAANAAVAVAAVESFLGNATLPIATEVVEEGLALSRSPGRLQVIATSPTVLVDGAHNPHGAEALTRALMTSFSFDRLICVVGVLSDKDVVGIIEALDAVVDHFVVTQSQSDRAIEVSALADIVAAIAGPDRVDARPHSESAVQRAYELAGTEGGIVVTGSLTLVAEVTEGLS